MENLDDVQLIILELDWSGMILLLRIILELG